MTTQTQTIADFLLARIAEDETVADEIHNSYDCDRFHGFTCDCPVPRKLLAECEAKRRIVARYQFWVKAARSEYADLIEQAMLETVEDLAQPYAGHPDFREEWRL